MANVRGTDGTFVLWCHRGQYMTQQWAGPPPSNTDVGVALKIEYSQSAQNTTSGCQIATAAKSSDAWRYWDTSQSPTTIVKTSASLPAVSVPSLGSFGGGGSSTTGSIPPGMTAELGIRKGTGTNAYAIAVFYGTPTSAGVYNWTLAKTDAVKNWRGTVQSEWVTYFPVEFHIYAYSYLNQNANGGIFPDHSTVITQTADGYTAPTYTITTTAPSRTGYTFLGWSTSSTATTPSYYGGGSYTGVLDGTSTLYAVWRLNTYTVTIAINTSGYGTVSPASITNVPYGSSISVSGNTVTINGTTVTATPASATAQYSYAFSSWSNTSGTITAARTITANFTRTTNSYTVSTAVSPSGTGSVTGGGSYTYGSSATLTAVPSTNYEFDKWQDDSTTNPCTVTVTGNTSFTAYFKMSRPPINYKVNGAWTQVTPYIKVNGEWVKIKKIYYKNNDTWSETK